MADEFIEDVAVRVDGAEHTGWQGVTVSVSIDALARSFNLQMAYDRRGNFPLILPGKRVEIYINNEKVITGFIDELDSVKTKNEHTRAVVGRSITRDIVDSSIVLNPPSNQINNKTPFEICQQLAERHGINVINEAGDQRRIPIFRWADGTKVGHAMRNVCRQQGLTIRDNADGDLVITRPRSRPSRGNVAEGSGAKNQADSNILGWRIRRSEINRHSHYIVKGRSTETDGKTGNQKRGEAQDDGVNSFRPLIIQAEGDVTNAICERRALHESQRRIAMSYPASITVSGWRYAPDRKPWRIDELLGVNIPSEDFNETLLIRSVVFQKRNGAGTTTRIEVVHPDSYAAEVTKAVKGKKDKFTGYISDLGESLNFIDGVTVGSGKALVSGE